MLVHGLNGWLERIPAYIRRVVQDEQSKDFTGQLWAPPVPFDWEGDSFDISTLGTLYIYESHVGMAQEKEGVGTYTEFTEKILPRIKQDGYNVVQLMAVAEHPYYGSFGYHVSNFFAPSSRFGTPEELKALIKRAHELGLAVVMDLVQAHYVKISTRDLTSWMGPIIFIHLQDWPEISPIGTLNCLIMRNRRWSISCCRMSNIGSMSFISMGSALTE